MIRRWSSGWASSGARPSAPAAVATGIKGGQVVGRTDRDGAAVVERPISVSDFLATVCTILGIDYRKKNYPPGVDRPIPIVDSSKGVSVLTELL